MALITLLNAQLAWGDQPLLDDAHFILEPGERVGLIGRNGTGKSSLLSVLSGKTLLDDGERQVVNSLSTYLLEQEPVLPSANSLEESLLLSSKPYIHEESNDYWHFVARLEDYLCRFNLNKEIVPKNLSGGENKKAVLALALALKPDLLLLDEPTNHLDITTIELIESILNEEFKYQRSLVVITHDRSFLDAISTRIAELDRGIIRSYPGSFSSYENTKASELHAEEIAHKRFDKFWAQEEVWIRKGIEARRTRNEGRVRRLEQLRLQRSQRRERMGDLNLNIDSGNRSGKTVAEVTDLEKSFNDKKIVQKFNFRLMRGDKLGLIGPNGIGKSTLIKLILGQLEPDHGTVKLGTNLQIAYFDQLRGQLDPNKTIAETIAPGSEWVEIAGQKKHIMAYLGDFLFPPHRANVPVSSLSGGEKNRLLLARLFALPANLLVLDEPTNDLDVESLELLEQTLTNYAGTIILVSHDRRFLDNVVTSVLVPDDNGNWKEYVGGYSDWLSQRPKTELVSKEETIKVKTAPKREKKVSLKLSNKEVRLLEELPKKIESLESEQADLLCLISSPNYHSQRSVEEIKSDSLRLTNIEEEVLHCYEQWEAIESKKTNLSS